MSGPVLLGCDFSSSPSRRKPIVVAQGRLQGARVQLDGLQRFETLEAWAAHLAQPGEWVGGFDLPFGLPRELVTTLGWPQDWLACMQHYAALTRAEIRDAFAAFCDARPVGQKFAHRATDGPAGSSPARSGRGGSGGWGYDWSTPPVGGTPLSDDEVPF